MNVIRANQEMRQSKVTSIANSIKKTLDKGKVIVYSQLILSTKVNLNLSEPTTKDYVERALFSLGVKKENLSDEHFVKIWSANKDE